MSNYNRSIANKVTKSLQEVLAIFTNGPRQAGKSTLMQQITNNLRNIDYITLGEGSNPVLTWLLLDCVTY